jgi:hypothetical protein
VRIGTHPWTAPRWRFEDGNDAQRRSLVMCSDAVENSIE